METAIMCSIDYRCCQDFKKVIRNKTMMDPCLLFSLALCFQCNDGVGKQLPKHTYGAH